MIIMPYLGNVINPLYELKVVLFGLQPGVPLHEFAIAILVIVVISAYFFYRWHKKSQGE